MLNLSPQENVEVVPISNCHAIEYVEEEDCIHFNCETDVKFQNVSTPVMIVFSDRM